MFRLAIKNYLLHFPYALLLMTQMLIVLFITNHTLIQVVRDSKTLDNVAVEKELYFVESHEENERRFLEDVSGIMGENYVGYMYRNIGIGMDDKDYRKTPSLEYISPTMEHIRYVLKEGKWFSDKENQIILGGAIAATYHAGDEVVLTMDGRQKKVVVTGILKNPGCCIHLNETGDGNLFTMMNQGWSVMLTNSRELLEWAGKDSSLEAESLVVDVEGRKSALEILKKKYKVTSFETAKENGTKQIRKETIGNGLYMGLLLGMAFLSVSIQIYMYMRRNKGEYQLYRMLGLGRGGIFALWCGQHMMDLGIVTVAFYALSKLIEKKQSSITSGAVDETTVFFLMSYCCVYVVLTVFVYRMAAKEIEKKEFTT